MKCFVAVLFLVAVADGDRCTPLEKYSAEYFAAAVPDAGDQQVIIGKLVADVAGRRLWESYDTVEGKGGVLFLFNENKVYVTDTKDGKCFKTDFSPRIPMMYIAKQLISKLSEDAKLLKSNNVGDSNLRVNLYGGKMEKHGHTEVAYTMTQTDGSCVLIGAAYHVSNLMTAKFDLFGVKMGIDEGKLAISKNCYKPPH